MSDVVMGQFKKKVMIYIVTENIRDRHILI